MDKCPQCGELRGFEDGHCLSCGFQGGPETAERHQGTGESPESENDRQQPHAASPNSDFDTGGHNRRKILKYGGGVSVGLLGLWALMGSGVSGYEDPEEAVRDFANHVDDDEPEEANKIIHEDGPDNADILLNGWYEEWANNNMSIVGSEILNDDDQQARVAFSCIVPPDWGDNYPQDYLFYLRNSDGWKIYKMDGSYTTDIGH